MEIFCAGDISEKAIQDLENIWLYTLEKWSETYQKFYLSPAFI
ncbi:hypothetical protein AGMMS4957_21990 [Bacteroidia bacterium]|nr:hypothetical protein AGMMS4957_21990 [Bacteroidia bacterium]